MQNTIIDDLKNEYSQEQDTESQTHEYDKAWQLKTVSEEELRKWEIEKERYDEVIEYIREVDEILNLIKPFPRDECEKVTETQQKDLVRSDSQSQSRYGLDHLENIIKLVEQLKELQENNSKLNERTCYLKDLKKLREHKKRLKDEEFELKSRTRTRSAASPEDFPEEFTESSSKSRKISSTASEKLVNETEGWQHKRKSLCLPHLEGQNKSKVSKWTKVKEAFHWERTSMVSRSNKKELFSLASTGEKNLGNFESGDYCRDHSPDDGSTLSALDGFSPPLLLPPPPPPPVLSRTHSSLPPRSEDLLSVRPIQDFPSSSSSDRLDDFFSETLAKGNKTPDADSSNQPFNVDDHDEVESTMRKSSSGEFPQRLSKEELTTRSMKSNKTTWGKVKDIIQTRKDSLKKKPKKRGSDEFKKRRKLSTLSNSQLSDQFEDLSSPEEKPKSATESIPKNACHDFPEDTLNVTQANIEEKCSKKLMPALTITLPSTEELRNFACEGLEKTEVGEQEKSNNFGHFSCQAHYCEDKPKYGKNKSGQNQRLSRWIKVKRVFLTSGSPSRPPNYSPVTDSSPTSQNKSSGFFSDLESDEVSSGEWIDEKSPSHEKLRIGDSESQSAAMALIQEDIRKSYNELQKKLSQEFDQKVREWELGKEGSARPDDSSPKLKEEGDSIPKFRKTRDTMAVPLPNLNDLSPEFKKKLNDWKKMKTSQSSSSVSSSATKEEIQGQNIKIRIGEWQPWRSRSSQKGHFKPEQVLCDEFSKKVEEDQKLKSGNTRPPSNRRKDKDGAEGTTARKDFKRRDSVKKISHSRTSSGGDSLVSNSSTDKDGKFIRKNQKEKDFQWVEKELQKIEREKLRLEQEKEKYLEREARLEKMKKTMGTAFPTQEILVRTPAGFFRFKGISQKFTKKLYEWEKARGIAPEASTFALLEESAKTTVNGFSECESGVPLQRSKSTGSVPELPSTLLIQTMAHHPSSLSLNDVDELKTDGIDDSISFEQNKAESEEPEAIIVDVEDIEEETALFADPPVLKCEIPVYSYAPEETDHAIDSAESTYLSGDDIKKENIARQQNVEHLEKFQEEKLIFRTTNKTFETTKDLIEKKELSKEFQGDSDEKILLLKDAKNIECLENVVQTSSKSALQEPISLDLIPKVHFHAQGLDQSKEEATVTTEPESIAPGLIKSPKTFFSWTSDLKMSDVSLPQKSSEDWEPSRNLKKNDNTSVYNSLRTRNDPEAIKRKIKEKITLMQRMSTEGKSYSRKHSEYNYSKSKREEKNFRLEEQDDKENLKSKFLKVDNSILKKETKFEENIVTCDNAINVFVPTTRKIISPVKTTEGTTPSVYSYVIDDVKSEETQEKVEKSNMEHLEQKQNFSNEENSSANHISKSKNKSTYLAKDHDQINSSSSLTVQHSDSAIFLPKKTESNIEIEKMRDIGIPPLPNSPKFFKKLNAKETAPSIRMIIAKYNQKISEHDNASEKRNDSGSPTIWRSPVFGRRTQEKIDMYKKNGEVQKSASLDNMRSIPQVINLTPTPDQESRKGILKSSSVDIIKVRPQASESCKEPLNFTTSVSAFDASKENSPSALRKLKIQRAKEDFLSGRLGGSSDASLTSTIEARVGDSLDASTTDKIIKIEVRVEDTENNLIKSVSAETINSEKSQSDNSSATTSKSLQKSSSKFDISSIKSKFRKIRMRKEKEPKINAVAALCRQSLFIEVPKVVENNQSSSSLSKSCPSSPVMDRNKSDKTDESKNSSGKKSK